MINIDLILLSKTIDISYEALKKTEVLCERSKELSDMFFETGKQLYLDQSVDLLNQAAAINCKFAKIYISLSHTCIKLELYDEAKALLSKVMLFEPKNLIAQNMLKIVNSKIAAIIAANKKKKKSAARKVNIFTEKFSRLFAANKQSANIKVKVSEGTFSKISKLFS